jgi:hypothetical protein
LKDPEGVIVVMGVFRRLLWVSREVCGLATPLTSTG